MDVFDLQASIGINTAPYLAALRAAAAETERIRTSMSAPITPTLPSSVPSSTPGSGGGGSGTGGGSGLPAVRNDAEEAGKALDDLNKKLGEGFAAAAKVAAAAWATASAAIVAGTKKAVEGFAQYEQLAGGVETLFKDSADTVKKYAEDAYKTAGMSANQYMETVTAFSASLISSLEGDTEAAAEKANIAITDMADNSNKMGSSLESLSRAYMGFSRQNFTMLDNLALGFSGTKEGMQQLLDKAEELSGIKFDISSYSDIIDAIHIVQEEMGITGTTAKEAADTIEGSLNSTKAAIDNLMVGFARSDADIDKLMGDVEENIANLANNTIPVAEKAFVAMSKTAINAGKEIAEKLPKLIKQMSTDVHKMIASSFGDSAKTIYGIEAALKAAAAAFVTFKAAAYVADVVEKIKALNAALSTTTTLTDAMKAANLVNPWVLAATAIAAATVALKSYIDAQTEAMEEAVDYYDRMSDSQKSVVDSIREFNKAVSENDKKLSESNDSIESNAMMCRDLTDQLFKLNEQEELSNEDKANMRVIVEQLNGSIEGLNITLDKQTGRLKTQKKEINEVISAYEKQAKAAAAQERLKDLWKEQFEAEKNLKDITEKRAEAKKKANEIEAEVITKEKELLDLEKQLNESNDIGGKITDSIAQKKKEIESLNKDLIEQKNVVGDLDETWRQASVGVKNNLDARVEMTKILTGEEIAATRESEAIDKSGESVKKLTGIVKDAATEQVTAYGTLNGKTVEWSEKQVTAVAEVIDEYIKYRKTVEDSVKGSVNIFDEFEKDSETTYNALLKNLNSNIEGVKEWTENIRKLRKDGILPDELIDQWEEMGIASQGYVRALANATKEQQQDFADTYARTQKTLNAAVHEAVKDDKRESDALLNELTGETGVKLSEYRKVLDGFITSETETYTKGIEEAVKAAETAAKDVTAALNGVDSESAGKSVMERFADSLSYNAKYVVEWARNMSLVRAEGAEPTIQGGKLEFPASTASSSGVIGLTVNLTSEIDGEVIARKTVSYMDDLQGKRAFNGAKGYAL